MRGKGREIRPSKEKEDDRMVGMTTNQLSVSGLTVLSLFRCFHHVLQLAFSNLTPLATSFLCLVMFLQDFHTSSSSHSCER